MRRTDFCHLTFFVRAPAPRWFSPRPALARQRERGDRLCSRQGDSLRRVARELSWSRPRRALSSRRGAWDRASDTPVASSWRDAPLARAPLLKVRQDHPPRARVNDARCRSDQGCLPSCKDLRPATPSRASGSGLRLQRDLAAAMHPIDAFSLPRPSRVSGARPPSTRPVASWRRASLSLGVACRLLQPFYRRAGTPDERSTTRTRVGLPPRYSPAPTDAGCVGCHGASPHREPASHDPHAPAFARRVPLAWTDESRAGTLEQRQNARSSTMRAYPPRGAPGTRVAGSARRKAWRTRRLTAPA